MRNEQNLQLDEKYDPNEDTRNLTFKKDNIYSLCFQLKDTRSTQMSFNLGKDTDFDELIKNDHINFTKDTLESVQRELHTIRMKVESLIYLKRSHREKTNDVTTNLVTMGVIQLIILVVSLATTFYYTKKIILDPEQFVNK